MRLTETNRQVPTAAFLPRWLFHLGLLLAWLAMEAGRAIAQDGAATDVAAELPFTDEYQGEFFTAELNELFRLRHIEGDGQGDVPAFTNLGFTKFIWGDSSVIMIDVGARLTNDAEGGFTGGVHRRALYGDFILGGGLFCDLEEYSQVSAAFEVFTPKWSFRANGYFVVGDDIERESEFMTTGATSIFFQGHNIAANNLELDETYEVAMDGFDLEVARNLGWHSAEAFVGSYYLDGEIGGDTFGGKTGVRGFIMPDLAASLTVTSDDIFGENLFGGFTWFFGGNRSLSRPMMDHKMTIPVERNEQVVVNEVRRRRPVIGNVVLTSDDDPIIVVHVDSAAAGPGDGTIEDPFNTLPATQNADIVYLHANSVFPVQSYSLAEGQRLLGESAAAQHFVETEELGDIVLPDGNGLANRPIIQAAPADAVTLADDSEVSNLSIQNSVGNGIFANGITEFDINRNLVNGSGGRGIFLNNLVGELDESGQLIETGELTNNIVSNNTQQNIQLVLASDFAAEVTGNTANGSTASRGIAISGPFRFAGDVSGNTADANFTDGIAVEVDEFFGDITANTASNNQNDGLLLAFDIFDGDVSGNTTDDNGDNGIDFSINGDFFSDADISGNTASNNGTEGISLLFSGTGTSLVRVLNNTLSGNNGGVGREFIAQNEDVFGNEPVVFIQLDGNTSANALGAGPPFNYEFENEDLFGDGEMTVELGTNVGTVGLGPDVDLGDFPEF